ncbi:26S proteasome non-ATPase regulatory subunit 11 homolog isoform X2 [Solanum dulcamara]|uniref:26S proteasome non-ATPase regulatory subunit 11 homolog isoform X2 n=1 Tax=Solanum dulcamara TaxID=45834 RepID=UPI002486555E|nr:26S proteasome non-ATPase regulatory subunit 11 homolog isoform X2 [Solanum dulcamara]
MLTPNAFFHELTAHLLMSERVGVSSPLHQSFQPSTCPVHLVVAPCQPLRIQDLLVVTMSSSYLPATTYSLAQVSEATTPSEAISILYRILENPSSSSEALRIKEQAIFNLSDLLSQEKWAEDLQKLLVQLRPFFSLIPKAKTAKIINKEIVDAVAKIPE